MKIEVLWALGLWTGLTAAAGSVVNAEVTPKNGRDGRELYFLDFLDPPECSAHGGCFLLLFGATMHTGTGTDCRETCAFIPFLMRLFGYTCGTCGDKGEKPIWIAGTPN